MASQPEYKIVQYAKDVITWCESKGITSFYHADLPDELQSTTGGMLRAAASRGFFRRGQKDSKSRVSRWHVITRGIEMANVSKYSTANVDKEKYYNFKKACQSADITILEAFNMIMDKFTEEHT